MYTHQARHRVIYGDTDNMGHAYYGNYFRWFEIGRSEFFRSIGTTYKSVEEKGVFLPVSEAHCKYVTPAKYDDILIIHTRIDAKIKSGMKFDYQIFSEIGEALIAKGYTRHACLNSKGRVIRPPEFLRKIVSGIEKKCER